MKLMRTFLFYVLAMVALPTWASMELSNVIFHFEPGEASREDVEIFNPGDTPMYVQIEPKRVLSPGAETEDRAPITDPREAGLLVTPNKLVIPPGGTKVVRMVKLGSSAEERVYRIGAKPVVDGIESESSGLKILIGYEILAIVYPDNPKSDLQVERAGERMLFRNTGNANVLLREGYQCETPDLEKEECEQLPGKRLYPGNTWELELPLNTPVTYYQSVGTRHSVETYP
ncbi:MAG: hypothetical protein GKR90_15485 [Pseudomonadales bacterium]|nr:hypothetical protein [Pseudomonadales bacterium]